MNKLTTVMLATALMALVLPIMYTFFAGLGAFAVGLAYPSTCAALAEYFNWPFKVWETGGFLGFLGAHLKTTVMPLKDPEEG